MLLLLKLRSIDRLCVFNCNLLSAQVEHDDPILGDGRSGNERSHCSNLPSGDEGPTYILEVGGAKFILELVLRVLRLYHRYLDLIERRPW